jgi:hypothetical protein
MIATREVFTTKQLHDFGLKVVLQEFTEYGLDRMQTFGMEASAKATMSAEIQLFGSCAVSAPLTRWEKILSLLHIRFQKRYGLEIAYYHEAIDEELRTMILMQVYYWEKEGRKCSKIMFSREAYMKARREACLDGLAYLDLHGTISTIYGLKIYVNPYLNGDVTLVC